MAFGAKRTSTGKPNRLDRSKIPEAALWWVEILHCSEPLTDLRRCGMLPPILAGAGDAF